MTEQTSLGANSLSVNAPIAHEASIGASSTTSLSPVPSSLPDITSAHIQTSASVTSNPNSLIAHAPSPSAVTTVGANGEYSYSPATAEVLARISTAQARNYDEARSHILNSIVTSDRLPLLPPSGNGARGPGRPRGSVKAGNGVSSPGGITSANVTTPVAKRGGTAGRGRGVGRGRGGGRKRGRKRKRDSDDDAGISDGDDSDGDTKAVNGEDEESDSGGVNLPLKTKSGRNVNRPAQFVPTLASPTANGVTLGPGKPKRKRIRKNVENAVCKSCERGHSPANNAIVFCDGCAGGWHQYCHDPPIEKEVIDIADKEWFCKECRIASRMDVEVPGFEGYVIGAEINGPEKRTRLLGLEKAKLVDILLSISGIYPNIALFPPDKSLNDLDGRPPDNPENHYDGYETDPPQHYPKPGNGLARTLPPETDDVRWLLDDNYDVFQHVSYDGTNGNSEGFGLQSQDDGLTQTGQAESGAANGVDGK